MELKANELRIGNLVEINMPITNKIISIDVYHISELKKNKGYFKPIPLTEEWLLKFGFEDDGVWIHKIIKLEHDRMLGIDLNNNHFFLSQWDKHNNFRDCFLVKCEFVHQLQNLFYSICGKELEIKM